MATINSIGTKYPIEVAAGGTGEAVMTQYAIAVGGATDLDYLAVGATGEILIGNTGLDASWSNTLSITSITVSGLGRGVVQSSAAGLFSSSEGIDGQLLVSSGTGVAIWANITSSGGRLDITNGANTIDIDTFTVLQSDSGFATWTGAGNYYDDTTIGEFEILRGGTGYIKGVPVTWAGAQTVVGLTSGNAYYIYVDSTGIIGKTATRTDSIYQDYIVLFQCWRDAKLPTNNQKTVKENHPYDFPVHTSNYLHNTVGSIIENYQGGANITLNGTQKIEISGADELDDHGLETDIPDSAGVAETFAHLYTDAAGKWVVHTATDTFPGEYNNAGTVTALGGNKYGVYTLYVGKDDLNTSTPRYGAVLNTAQYNNIASARLAISTGGVAISTNELSVMENCRLGYIIFAEATTSIIEVIIDKNTLRSVSSTSGTNVASLINTTVTNFDGILSAADTNVQSALETVDDWGKTTTDHAILIGNGTGVAIGSLAVGGANEALLGAAGADPVWGTVPNATLTNSSVTLSNGNNITVTGSPLSLGGTASFNLTGTTQYAIQLGNATGSLTSFGLGDATKVLTSAGAGADPTWESPTIGTVTSVSGGNNITDSGTATDPVLDLDAAISGTTSITVSNGGALRTGVNAADTLLLQAYDVNGAAYTTFATLTANNDPSMDLNTITTLGTKYIYRADGTDIPIADGGTNASSMTTTYGVNYYDGSSIVTTAVGTATHVLTSNGVGVAPTFQATGAGTVTSVSGGTNITDSGTATDPILDLDATITLTTVNATTFDTNVAAAGVTLAGTSLLADGTDANIDINITAKGTGQVIIDDLQLTTDLTVPYGGTGASTFTDHGVLLGSGAGAITVLGEASNGQLVVGSTGNDPSLATLTEGVGIDITNASGSITIASTGTTLNNQTGTTYTLVLTDAGKFITFTNAAAITVTVPTNAAVAFPIGTQIGFQQGGAGQATFSGAVPPTLKSADDAYTTVKLYSVGYIIKIATDVWAIGGDMEA